MSLEHHSAIASISLGWHPLHTLERKLHAASSAGYDGIEIFYSDLEKFAQIRKISVIDAANLARDLCAKSNLSIISLCSFDNFEGMPTPLADRLRVADHWVSVARALGAPIVQVPATYDPASRDVPEDVMIKELQALADSGVGNPVDGTATITFAYEFMGWSVHVATWQDALRYSRQVARPNFGLCFDTYHILSRLWGDCTRADGRVPGGDEALSTSIQGILRDMRPEDIVFVQLSDVEKMEPPLDPKKLQQGQHYSAAWCSWGRLFPLEQELGAYMPMEQLCRVLLHDLGWSGWVSMETFHRHMADEDVGPEVLAKRGMQSWAKLCQLTGIEHSQQSKPTLTS
ncbi:hypothetical protein FH972_021825 [Carpinus fangiana]|uniref:Xylose isomerase-like TIM barrel domain-containing protein n=1 Tax=Carpinus fangiana TaxID=176857 RepID=A0A5N6KSJ7_9ROSI|nr:hypothetical protein FH972_021825 [Carpinus fangiana]